LVLTSTSGSDLSWLGGMGGGGWLLSLYLSPTSQVGPGVQVVQMEGRSKSRTNLSHPLVSSPRKLLNNSDWSSVRFSQKVVL
jgi:hypothetical protein